MRPIPVISLAIRLIEKGQGLGCNGKILLIPMVELGRGGQTMSILIKFESNTKHLRCKAMKRWENRQE